MPDVTGRAFSGLGATVAIAVALVLGLLAAVLVTSAASPAPRAEPVVVSPTTPASPASEEEPGLRLTGQPVTPRSQEGVTEPTTATPVLPQRCLVGDETLPSKAGRCVITAFGPDRPTVVLWGDSHAWQQVPALRAEARRTRTNLVAFLMGTCPPMDLRGAGYRGACVEQGQDALGFVAARSAAEQPVTLVLGGFWELYRDYHQRAVAGYAPDDAHEQFLVTRAAMFDVGGARLFDTLARRGVRTAAIAQAPWVGEDAATCAAGEQPYACDLPRSSALPAEADTARWLRAQLAGIPASDYLDTSRFVCDAEVCHAALRGAPVFLDELHLDPAVTRAFAPEYRALFS